ncbi:MAG TPA: di-heme oxidoredictase family protein, partial [Polyangia bacterium]|nr:di-heme oxidoredictase family protein [Polyangia bacterium]
TRMFGDGTSYTLTKPTTVFAGMTAGPPANYSLRLARPLIGMGLLEAIPEADILAHADPTDCDGNGIKGVPNVVYDPEDGTMKIGRFGWKASKASVRMQAAEALNLDIGVTTSVYPKHDCGSAQAGCTSADKATPELTDDDLLKITTYMRTLGVPARRDLAVPAVVRGEALFASLGCVGCHEPNQHTGTTSPFLELQNQVIHPYSDLLLHDMGTDLADNNSQNEFVATTSMWRTPPLWGIGLCDEVSAGFQMDQTLNPAPNNGPCHYLHDGRAATLLEAVLWHGGEAAAVQKKVVALPSADRDALVAFLKSL